MNKPQVRTDTRPDHRKKVVEKPAASTGGGGYVHFVGNGLRVDLDSYFASPQGRAALLKIAGKSK